MTQLAPIQLDDGTAIYIALYPKPQDDVTASISSSSEGTTRTFKMNR